MPQKRWTGEVVLQDNANEPRPRQVRYQAALYPGEAESIITARQIAANGKGT